MIPDIGSGERNMRRRQVTCPYCGKRSYNPKEIQEKFCIRCRVFWGEAPLNDYEVEEWVTRLGINREARMKALRELLRNANGDHMTPQDRVICNRELQRLQEADWKAKGVQPPAPVVRPRTRWPGAKGLAPGLGTKAPRTKPSASERVIHGGTRSSDTCAGTLGHEAEGPDQAPSDSIYPPVPTQGTENAVPNTTLEQAS